MSNLGNLNRGKEETLKLKTSIEEITLAIGERPSSIPLVDIQEAVSSKLAAKVERAEKEVSELFARLIERHGESQLLDKIDDIFLGENISNDIKKLVAKLVEVAFAENSEGPVQLSRFIVLRQQYEKTAAELVNNFFPKYLEDAAFLVWSVVANKVDFEGCKLTGELAIKLVNAIGNQAFRNVVKPVFVGLHEQVMGQESIWGEPLVEVNAEIRIGYEKKLEALKRVIELWEELIEASNIHHASFTSPRKRPRSKSADDGEEEVADEVEEMKY